MRFCQIAIIVSGLFSSAAFAADFPVQPIAPIAVPAFNWSGIYIGVNGGYGSASGRADLTVLDGPFAGLVANSTGGGIRGALAGGQLGANWQSGILVLGIEADYQWADIGRTVTYGCGAGCSITEKVGLTSFGTVRGRVGAAFDRVLIYGTAGGAWLTARDEATMTLGAVTGQLGRVSLSGFGWTAGGGLEVAIGPNWSIKGEYLYLSTSGLTGQGAVTGVGNVRVDVDAHAHIGRVGINYRF